MHEQTTLVHTAFSAFWLLVLACRGFGCNILLTAVGAGVRRVSFIVVHNQDAEKVFTLYMVARARLLLRV